LKTPIRETSEGSEAAAIRTLPVNSAACKPPEVFIHASVAYLKTARACPAKGNGFAATAAYEGFLSSGPYATPFRLGITLFIQMH